MDVLGPITSVAVSTVCLEELTYVSMSITPAGQSRTRVGYLDPRGEENFYVSGEGDCYVVGFNLAVDDWGICAMQCIFSRGDTSRWIGRADNVPVGRLLADDGTIRRIKALVWGGIDAPYLRNSTLGVARQRLFP